MPSTINASNSGSGGLISAGDASGVLALQTGGTTAITVDTSQNVGIGTSSPLEKLNVAGAILSSGQLNGLRANTSVFDWNAGTGTRIISTGANSTDYPAIVFASTSTTTYAERMRIDSSGSLILAGSTAQKATGTTWSNPSDQRLKDNIRDYAKGMTELMQVRVREWEYNGKGGTVEGTKGLGVIADEVMTVLPNTVENYDAKLNADDDETTAIKKFDATEITWLLVKAFQELKTEFDEYKATHP